MKSFTSSASIGLLIGIGLALVLSMCTGPVHAGEKSQKEKFCGSLANIAAIAATKAHDPGVKHSTIRKEFEDRVATIADEVTREWIMAAVDFGLAMSRDYPPATIARYQYYGCWTTA